MSSINTLKLLLVALVFTTFFNSCGETAENKSDAATATPTAEKIPASNAPAEIQKIETAHKRSDFLSKKAIQFDIVLTFGNKVRLDGTLTLATNSSKALITYKDGRKIYVVGDKVHRSPNMENAKSARFAAYTWSYFFMLPYKLSDGGTVWSNIGQDSLDNQLYNAQKLNFEAGTGDAPDDWYYIYSKPENDLVEHAAYIVTAGQSKEAAEEDPHSIQYLDYKSVGGIPIAHEWKFWEWRTTEGLTRVLGGAVLSNIKFVEPKEDFFTPPSDFLQ